MKPRIGIRPVIDGRWMGIRESLEEQTMNMAKNAKKIIEEVIETSNYRFQYELFLTDVFNLSIPPEYCRCDQ